MLFTGSVVVPCSLVRWFVGCWFCFFGSGLRFGAMGMQLSMFVLSRWFGACRFLLFDSTLQGWGLALVVGAVFLFFLDYYCFLDALQCSTPAPTSTHEVSLFSLFGKVDICSSMRFCCCFSAGMKENSCMKNTSRSTCAIAISVVFLLK
jgi:hypothetical protein